jgi:hypothetical protein
MKQRWKDHRQTWRPRYYAANRRRTREDSTDDMNIIEEPLTLAQISEWNEEIGVSPPAYGRTS